MYEPRYYQREAIDAIVNYLNLKTGNPIAALPTGTGKSIVFAKFAQEILQEHPRVKMMMLTHVKELIAQNSEKLLAVWPQAPVGIYSAGLKRKESSNSIVCGGIQSVVRALEKDSNAFGHRNVILVDECHLISPKDSTSYRKAIDKLKEVNPNLRVVGLTATPYRLKSGCLVDEGSIFTDICYDLCTREKFNKLLDEGFLSPLIPKRPETMVQMDGVKTTGGDYNKKQMQEAVDRQDVTYNAVKEMVKHGYDRKSWLVFAAGIENAENIADMLGEFGIDAAASHSKLPPEVNNERIAAFKRGELRALVNNNKLTTGFDHPGIDLIGMLRPTTSPGLWVQMLGRGTRPCPGKKNCLVLDFAGNTERLGPINDPVIPKKRGSKAGTGEAPIKICPECGTYCHTVARFCPECQFEFERKSKLKGTASSHELIAKGNLTIPPNFKPPETITEHTVDMVFYKVHEKKGSRYPTLQVNYACGINSFKEWICFSHPAGTRPRVKAENWWKLRCPQWDAPPSSHFAAQYACENRGALKMPRTIKVKLDNKYSEIVGVTF